MELWQGIALLVGTAAGGVWAAVRWYLQFLAKNRETQRIHEEKLAKDKREHEAQMAADQRGHDIAVMNRFEKIQENFLAALDRQEERCNKERAAWVEENKAQRDARLTEAKGYIENREQSTERLQEILRTTLNSTA